MTEDYNELEAAIEEAIQLLAVQRGMELATAVSPIILTNLDRSRVRHYLDNHADVKPVDYVWRVADYYEERHRYVAQVQVEKPDEVWEPLYEQLQKWAYNFLRRHHFPADGDKKTRFEHAVNCATETGTVLVNAHFPYDVDFEPWAHVLLQHVSLKYLSQILNTSSVAEDDLVALDAWDNWLQNLADSGSREGEEQAEWRHDLLNAMEQLSSKARKEFIRLYYFEHRSFNEIAVRMHKSVNALYKLHHDALKELGKILDKYQDIYG